MRKAYRIALIIGLAILACKAIVSLAIIAIGAWRQTYTGDALIFLSVGRAMLEGLTPYVDVFENKPPAIFILSAIAQYIDQHLTFARIAEIIALTGLPFIAMLGARAPVEGEQTNDRRWRMLILGCCGVLLAVLGAQWSMGLYTESFAAFFGCLFVTALLHRDRAPRAMTVIAGAALAISGLFKEPAAIAAIGAALIFSPTPRSLLRTIVFPSLVAILVAFTILVISGTLVSYITIELPYIIHWHPLLAAQMANSVNAAGIGGGGLRIDRVAIQFWNASPWLTIGVSLMSAIALYDSVAQPSMNNRLWKSTCLLIGIFLGIAAAQAGGDSGHRLVTIFPILLALAVRALMRMPTYDTALRRIGYAMLAIPISIGLLIAPIQTSSGPSQQANTRSFAEGVDRMLYACGLDRYLLLSMLSEDIYGRTRHFALPAGPLSISIDQRIQIPFLLNMIAGSLAKTDVVIMKRHERVQTENPEFIASLVEYMQQNFTGTPPPCAQGLVVPDDVRVLFRQ